MSKNSTSCPHAVFLCFGWISEPIAIISLYCINYLLSLRLCVYCAVRASFLTILTYLLTTRWRVLLQKLTGLQLVKKFPAFHGTRMFITALTSLHHLSLSWTNPIQSIYPHPTSWRSILILSTHLRLGLPSGLLPSSFQIRLNVV